MKKGDVPQRDTLPREYDKVKQNNEAECPFGDRPHN